MSFRVRAALAGILSAAALSGCGSSPDNAIAHPNAVDIGFAQDMSLHHDQAILMSQVALRQGTPAVTDIAAAILSSQAQEIGALRGWLQVWGRPAVDPTPMGWMDVKPAAEATGSMSAMAGMPAMSMPAMSMPATTPTPGSMDYAPMPGMATPAQMLTLTNAHGRAFDILFAQLMIRHHLGGIAMDKAALAQGASALVSHLADQEIAEQFQDISYLTTVLRSYGMKVG